VFGTGGQTLDMLKKVMGMLSGLKTLELKDLLLDGREGLVLLDEVRGGFSIKKLADISEPQVPQK